MIQMTTPNLPFIIQFVRRCYFTTEVVGRMRHREVYSSVGSQFLTILGIFFYDLMMIRIVGQNR